MLVRERRAGVWSQQQARRLQLAFIREWWRCMAAVTALLAAAIAMAAVLVPNRFSSFVLGAGLASACWFLASMVDEGAGTKNHRLGGRGEEWTSDALRKLRRRGWHLIEHVPLAHGDVDHVLIGPGGVYAIETKTTTRPRAWNVDKPDHWLKEAVAQARHRAERVQRMLLERETSVRTDVRPLLVLWGPMQGTTEEVNGVRVVHGSDLPDWREGLSCDALDPDAIERAASGLERFVAMRDTHIRATGGMGGPLIEHGPLQMLRQLGSGLLGGCLAFLVIALLLQVLPDVALLPLLVVGLGASVVVLRSGHLRLPALGWAAMWSCLTTVLLAAYLWS